MYVVLGGGGGSGSDAFIEIFLVAAAGDRKHCQLHTIGNLKPPARVEMTVT